MIDVFCRILQKHDILILMKNKKTQEVLLKKEGQSIWKVDDVAGNFDVFVVHRMFFDHKKSSWKESDVDKLGVYLLITYSESNQKSYAYVGKSSERGVLTRLLEHHRNTNNDKKPWTTAIVLVKTTTSDFTQNECSFLELEFYDALKENEFIELLNKNRPSGDPSLPRSKSKQLIDLAKFVLDVADAYGLPIADEDDMQLLLSYKETANPDLRKFVKAAEEMDMSMYGEHDGQRADIHINGDRRIVHLGSDKETPEEYTSLSQAMKVMFPHCSKRAWDFWRIKSTGKTARERYHELI